VRTFAFYLNGAILAACLCLMLTATLGCNRSAQSTSAASAAKHYAFKGKVVSVDKNAGTANIDNEPIAGFMDAMTMPYTIKPPSALDQLRPGDSITADVMVEPDKYWLENVKVTAHATASAAKPATNRSQ
jgi:protein SCO1